MRRGPTIYLRLSHGRLEAGPGGGLASCCLEISPLMGRHEPPTRHTMGQRRPAALAAETDGSAIYGAAFGPPFPFPTGGVAASLQSPRPSTGWTSTHRARRVLMVAARRRTRLRASS
jgi:hypothetical protein